MSQEIFIDFKPDMIVFWKVTCGNSHVWPIRIHITFSVRLHILSTWCCEKKFVHQLRVLLYLHEKTLKLHTKLVFLACYRMNSLFCNSSLKFQKAVREQNGQRVSLMNVQLLLFTFRGADWVWSWTGLSQRVQNQTSFCLRSNDEHFTLHLSNYYLLFSLGPIVLQ